MRRFFWMTTIVFLIWQSTTTDNHPVGIFHLRQQFQRSLERHRQWRSAIQVQQQQSKDITSQTSTDAQFDTPLQVTPAFVSFLIWHLILTGFSLIFVVWRSSDDENEMLYSPKKASPKPSPMTSRKYMGLGLMQSNTHNSPPSLPADFSDLASVTSNDVDLTSSPGSPRRKVKHSFPDCNLCDWFFGYWLLITCMYLLKLFLFGRDWNRCTWRTDF